MKTIRTGTAGKLKLRLVATGEEFVALAQEGSKILHQFSSADANEAWQALQRELSRSESN